jgi:hypothetical protein
MVSAAMVSSGTHVLAHRPADHFAGEQVEDHGQVEPALGGRDIGDVGQPNVIGSVRDKALVQQVFRHRQRMLAVSRADAKAARRPCPDAVLTHEPGDPLAAGGLAFGAQLGVDARRPVSLAVPSMNPPDIGQQLTVGDLARALRP